MNRDEFVKELVMAGCYLRRHGAKHDIYANPRNGKQAPVPRHTEIKKTLANPIQSPMPWRSGTQSEVGLAWTTWPRFGPYRGAPFGESGVVLLGLLLLLLIVSSSVLLKDLNVTATTVERDQRTILALAGAKAALIAWTVSHPNNPGTLPFPDRRELVNPNYDGTSDCPPALTTVNTSHLLGRLPWRGQNSPCQPPRTGLFGDFRDSAGEGLWYAVSRNLVHRGSTPACPTPPNWPSTGLDSRIINATPTINSRWITVRNADGTVRSNRVAFVVLAPGPPVGNQNRSGTAPPANRYLDSVTVFGTTHRNSDTPLSATTPFDFIIYPNSDTTPQADDRFNDALVYVTIDELMREVEKRAVAEARKQLREFFTTNNYYPFPADLGDASGACDASNLTGFLPMTAGSCTGAAVLSFTQAPWFECHKWDEHMYYAVAPACINGTTSCGGTGFLTSGTSTNVRAVLIGAGPLIDSAPFAASKDPPAQQLRPSADPIPERDYLDSIENANSASTSDFTYDAPGTEQTAIYNDQVVIVAP